MDAPNVYHYLPSTGELHSVGFADPSPREPGKFLVPAYATLIPPGDVEPGFVAVFRDDLWIAVADHRGETWWKDGLAYTITGLGDPANDGYSPDGPPEAEPGYAVVWHEGAWVSLKDHRGETWWSGHNQPVIIDFLGDPLESGLFPENPPAPEPEPEPEPEPVDPLTVALTKRQVNAALIIGGQVTDPDGAIEAAISQMQDPIERALALNDWRNAPYYERTHDLFNDPHLLATMDITPEQVDQLWLLGSTLPA